MTDTQHVEQAVPKTNNVKVVSSLNSGVMSDSTNKTPPTASPEKMKLKANATDNKVTISAPTSEIPTTQKKTAAQIAAEKIRKKMKIKRKRSQSEDCSQSKSRKKKNASNDQELSDVFVSLRDENEKKAQKIVFTIFPQKVLSLTNVIESSPAWNLKKLEDINAPLTEFKAVVKKAKEEEEAKKKKEEKEKATTMARRSPRSASKSKINTTEKKQKEECRNG